MTHEDRPSYHLSLSSPSLHPSPPLLSPADVRCGPVEGCSSSSDDDDEEGEDGAGRIWAQCFIVSLMEGGGGTVEDLGGHHVLHFVQRLRHVFDVCDEDADGFIKVDDFIDLGQQFIQGEEVEKVVRYLDPNELGRINFKDFCHGILALKGCNQLLRGVLGVTGVSPPPYQTQYGEYYYQ
ncbi:PREDICTED: rab11 family-interacting protein 4-like, partial [Nanorana parkeri]|uniref:rab11 family-interacting protein 4-like n=1 Tax=Nanorana parkeri TaxID=125878 RepID=UPI0008550171